MKDTEETKHLEKLVLGPSATDDEHPDKCERCGEPMREVLINGGARVDELIRRERELCKQDVCPCCGGRVPGASRIAVGPNSAGNWTHDWHGAQRLCVASSIFARARAGKDMGDFV